jgi:hypothetical protein
MHFKSIVLELLQARPAMYDQLRTTRRLLPALERMAAELKSSHEACKSRLFQMRPGSSESQIASEALELALKAMEASLPTASSPDENDPLSLDAAMAFIRRRMPPA